MHGQKHAEGRQEARGGSDSRCEKNKKTFQILTGCEDLRVSRGAVKEAMRQRQGVTQEVNQIG